MAYLERAVESSIERSIERKKSLLLLGPRQTGKTTIIEHLDDVDIELNFAQTASRLRYERDPGLLANEIEQHPKKFPLVFIDEVQKLPAIFDDVQYLVDKKIAQFILTGSSIRKLKRAGVVNLLPGRIHRHYLDPLQLSEYRGLKKSLNELLLFGSLPEILLLSDEDEKEFDLNSYVGVYLDEEIKAEAAVRNLGNFSRFLFLAAAESGNIVNHSKLSQEIGVAHTTVMDYYQILEDCMIVERIDPYTKTKSRRLLTKSPKYLFFDLGVRRLCAGEGRALSLEQMGKLFEQFVGLELKRYIRARSLIASLYFWRSANGPEVDWVVEHEGRLIPIEVKWTERPTEKDASHLKLFLKEYDAAEQAYIVCRTTQPFQVAARITAIPWQMLGTVI